MNVADYVPIGQDWFISVALIDKSTGQPLIAGTITATLKNAAGTTITVLGQGDATAALAYDATDERWEATIAGLRLTGLTNGTIYYLWVTEANGKLNRKIPVPALFQGKI